MLGVAVLGVAVLGALLALRRPRRTVPGPQSPSPGVLLLAGGAVVLRWRAVACGGAVAMACPRQRPEP